MANRTEYQGSCIASYVSSRLNSELCDLIYLITISEMDARVAIGSAPKCQIERFLGSPRFQYGPVAFVSTKLYQFPS